MQWKVVFAGAFVAVLVALRFIAAYRAQRRRQERDQQNDLQQLFEAGESRRDSDLSTNKAEVQTLFDGEK